MRWWSRARRRHQEALQRIELLQHAHQAALQGLAERLDRLSASLDADNRHRLAGVSAPGNASPVSLAQSGAGAEDLIRHCGLRAAEAELLLALYGERRADHNVTRVA